MRKSDGAAAPGEPLTTFLARVAAVVKDAHLRGWVRAEITKTAAYNGHLYVDLVDHDESGAQLARTRANIWRDRATKLNQKFNAVTGAQFPAPNTKVLIEVEASFHPAHGFSLNIIDVDPQYTLGDIAQKLAAIKARLITENLFENNRALQTPVEFTSVAVIAPRAAAGLADFESSARRLERFGLCRFVVHTAVFQGADSKDSLLGALRTVLVEQRARRYDCLCIIRGGGAVVDLAFLNEYELARAICLMPLPVFTGIGHNTDHGALDAVAHRSFDTPSKVIEDIEKTILRNAQTARNAYSMIRQIGIHISTSTRAQIDITRAEIVRSAGNDVVQMHQASHMAIRHVESSARAHVTLTAERVASLMAHTSAAAKSRRDFAQEQVDNAWNTVKTLPLRQINAIMERVTTNHADVVGSATRCVVGRVGVINEISKMIHERVENATEKAVQRSTARLDEIFVKVRARISIVDVQLKAMIEIVLGLHPKKVIDRGYAIVTSDKLLVATAVEALKHKEVEIRFRDGAIRATPLVLIEDENHGDRRK